MARSADQDRESRTRVPQRDSQSLVPARRPVGTETSFFGSLNHSDVLATGCIAGPTAAVEDRTLGSVPAKCTETRLEQALEQWAAVLGAAHPLVDRPSLAAAETATFSTTQSVPAILRPANRAQVQECICIANLFRVPVYPVSSGKNWGYGSRVPTADSSVLLDLSRLNQIVDFNEELAYVTVEPGVTQRQLHQFLQTRESRLWLDATGSSPDCSLIGNVMERGFGHTPYGDHFAQVCGFEVVLPTGGIAQTGFSRFPNSQTGPVYKW